jgi:hypothetical protein
MAKKPLSSPLTEPVFITSVGFDFLPLHVVLSVEYPAEFGKIHGPKKSARFLVENTSLRALGAKFIEVADLLETKGNA